MHLLRTDISRYVAINDGRVAFEKIERLLPLIARGKRMWSTLPDKCWLFLKNRRKRQNHEKKEKARFSCRESGVTGLRDAKKVSSLFRFLASFPLRPTIGLSRSLSRSLLSKFRARHEGRRMEQAKNASTFGSSWPFFAHEEKVGMREYAPGQTIQANGTKKLNNEPRTRRRQSEQGPKKGEDERALPSRSKQKL